MKILQITDLHFATYPFQGRDLETKALIQRLVEREQPDLLAVTGDLISNYRTLDGLSVFKGVIAFLDSLGIEVAVTFGNHDSESHSLKRNYEKALSQFTNEVELADYKASIPREQLLMFENLDQLIQYNRQDLIEVVNGMKNHIKKQAVDIINGKEVYYIDANEDTRLLFVDSGDYDDLNIGLYDSISFDQQAWIVKHASETDRISHLFIHIPLPEYADAVVKGLASGHQAEKICSADYNTGTWSQLKLNTNVKSIYCGHDHENDFSADYFGIQLNYGRSSGFNSYGNLTKGGRIIEIHAREWKTYIVE